MRNRGQQDGRTAARVGAAAWLAAIAWLAAPAPDLQAAGTGHTFTITSLAFSPDGRRLASGSADELTIVAGPGIFYSQNRPHARVALADGSERDR